MFPNDPRAAIAHMPYLLDVEPKNILLVAGFDEEGELRHRASFRIDGKRPLDEPLLESSLWLEDIVGAAAVAYSALPSLDLRPLAAAWGYRGRSPLAVAWASDASWRSYLCENEDCCSGIGHSYSADVAAHPREDSSARLTEPVGTWRRARWNEWQQTIANAADGLSIDPQQLERLAATLHDIPIRDALLAYSADPDARVLTGVRSVLVSIARRSTLGIAIPAQTCLAAMHYLGNDLSAAAHLVDRLLAIEEYSLARLLHNGLEMRAPASLLARSFAHFSPLELLAA